MRKTFAALTVAAVTTLATPAFSESKADFCAGWKATCLSRGGKENCEPRYKACLSSGCFTQGAKYGGARVCASK
ncbi:MAG: hypothetical protein QOJ84_2345 [Bradyrhizobium sp.]|nr:hypothetical protein [Bradyrhizobium sp.]